jgi:hypothetical protein
MAKKTKVRLNAKKLHADMMKKVVGIQTERLINYAISEVTKMGDELLVKMRGKPSDRTHNMLNSLVWAVYYDGKEEKHGYYRKSSSTRGDASLHEISKDPIAVNGRQLARQFLDTYQPRQKNGWEIIWAILAPYYAYWEQGHENVFYGKYVKFNMMTQRYDDIKNALGTKVNVTIQVNVPKY